MTSKRDYYEILGVAKDASFADIKKAYRKQQMHHHPDRNKSHGAEERSKEINGAYHVLSDPEKRQQYDRFIGLEKKTREKQEGRAREEAKRKKDEEERQRREQGQWEEVKTWDEKKRQHRQQAWSKWQANEEKEDPRREQEQKASEHWRKRKHAAKKKQRIHKNISILAFTVVILVMVFLAYVLIQAGDSHDVVSISDGSQKAVNDVYDQVGASAPSPNHNSYDVVSISNVEDVRFEYEAFGHYKITGLDQPYFVGYDIAYSELDGSIINSAKLGEEILNINLLENGYISQILIDSKDKYSLAAGDGLELMEGYVLSIQAVDLERNAALVELIKDDKVVDTEIVYPGTTKDTYVYDELDLGGQDNVPTIIARINEVFRGTDTNVVTIEGLFQISDVLQNATIDVYNQVDVSAS